MALLDFLKNKKEADKAKEKKAVKTSVAKKVEKKEEVKAVEVKPASTVIGKFSYEVVKEPLISEKANILGEQNKYVFKIYNGANKPQIKQAVEGIYNVNVLAVTTINIPKKKRRLGKTQGYKKAYRKAIVTLKAGQKIEVF